MANFTIDPNTGINIPTVGVDPGPDYATNVSNALTKLSALTHTGAANQDGIQIPSAGININADLTFQNQNATNLRSTRLISQPSNIIGPNDINCLYDVLGNLWFNNGFGQEIQLTAGSAIISPTSINYNQASISTNTTISSSSNINSFLVNSSSSPITITLPISASVAAGRFFIFYDQNGSSNTNNITIRTSSSDTINGGSNIVLRNQYGSLILISDGVSTWSYYKFDQTVFQNVEGLTFQTGSLLALNSGSTLSGNSGSTTTFASGANVTFNTPISINSTISGSIDFAASQVLPSMKQVQQTSNILANQMIITAQDAFSSATGSNRNGGDLLLGSGNQSGAGVPGVIQLTCGNGFAALVLQGTSTTTTLAGGGTTILTGTASTTTLSGGAATVLQGTATTLTLSGGTSSQTIMNGRISLSADSTLAMNLQPTAVTMFPSSGSGAFQVNKWQGVFNTQIGKYSIYQYVNNTTASGSDVLLDNNGNGYTIFIPSLSGVIIKIQWIRRNTTGSGCLGNEAEMIVIANGGGTMTSSGLTAFVAASGAFANVSDITVDVATSNTVKLYFHAAATAADWQATVTVSII